MTDQEFADYMAQGPAQRDAWVMIDQLLQSAGLSQLSDFAKNALVQGKSDIDVVYSLRQQEVYKKRFAVIDQRKAAGLPAISEAEVIAYEKGATTRMRAAGMPEGFWDQPEDFVKLQLGDVSLAEVDSRINEGYVMAMQAPQDVRDQWKMYGFSEGDLAAYMLDPDRTQAVITKQIGSVTRAAEAQRAGFGQLTKEQGEQLMALGITDAQSQQGFGELADQKELMNALPGEAGDGITTDEQLAAQFANNAAIQQRIKRQASQRAATFQQGGAFTSNREGFAGVGEAR